MAEIVKESVLTQNEGPKEAVTKETKFVATKTQTVEYLIYFFFSALEVLLAFRLILKLMGASTSSVFVSFIYGITALFVFPFEGIFRKGFAPGLETTSVLEPSTLVALIVYVLLALGIIKLVRISSGEQQPTV